MAEITCPSDCLCHVNPFDYVPCCPLHHIPLRAAEAGHGECPWVRQASVRRHVGGAPLNQKSNRCITYGSDAWVWIHRDVFNQSDLPPHNGDEPPRVPKVGSPWSRFETRCRGCGFRTLHVEGQNRRICTVCGNAQWVPTPAYGESA